MKKKVIFLVLTLVFCIGCFNLGKLFKADVLEDKVNESDSVKQLSSLNTLSMMIETEAGSGEYALETRSSWPTEGYVFNEELSKCENGSTLSWDDENNVVVMGGSTSDKCYVYFDVIPPTLLADWVKEQYNNQIAGSETIYYHDSNLENGAGDNSYRYSGSSSSVNNYVCFGSDEDTCPHDNLYRIIGVFDDRVRLIKADYATSAMLGTDTSDYYNTYSGTGWNTSYYQGSVDTSTIGVYYWNKVNYNASYSATNYYNDWSYSELNKTHLNKNYISYLDNINTKWANMIDTTTWKVGGNTYANMYNSNAKTAYASEITSPSDQVTNTYESKIGLMYLSDYYYGANKTYWTYLGYSSSGASSDYRAATGENWMYMGLYEWTMVRSSSFSDYAYIVYYAGFVNDDYVYSYGGAVRPVFHLTSKVIKLEGSGELENPVRISAGA